MISNDALDTDLFVPCQGDTFDVADVGEAMVAMLVVALLVRAGLPVSTQAAVAYGLVASMRTDGKIANMAVPQREQMETALTHARPRTEPPVDPLNITMSPLDWGGY